MVEMCSTSYAKAAWVFRGIQIASLTKRRLPLLPLECRVWIIKSVGSESPDFCSPL